MPTQWPTWKSCEFLHTEEAGAELDENSDTILTESDDLVIDIHLIVNLNKFSSLTKLIALSAYIR